VNFVRDWSERTGLASTRLVRWIGIPSSKDYEWRKRYGHVKEHHAWVPRDHWIEDGEKEAILKYQENHSAEGYRRLAFMMLDALSKVSMVTSVSLVFGSQYI